MSTPSAPSSTLTPGKLWGLRRMANARGHFAMTAVDQRPPIKGPIAAHLGVEEAPWEAVADVKRMLVETLGEASTAMLLDPHYAIPRAIDALSPAVGLVVTLEDSVFETTEGGRLSAAIDDWSVAKIKRMGADAVKVLAWYRPDAGERVRRHQEDWTKRIGEACARHDIPFLFELLVYPLDGSQTDYAEMEEAKGDHVLRSVETFAHPDFGVDVFKLEAPLHAASARDHPNAQALFDELGRLAGRPWVMLSAGAGKDDFTAVVERACRAGASGYLAGRAIWADAFRHWPNEDVMRRELAEGSVPYMQRLNGIVAEHATPWHAHPCWGENGARFEPADASFRHRYGEA